MGLFLVEGLGADERDVLQASTSHSLKAYLKRVPRYSKSNLTIAEVGLACGWVDSRRLARE